MHKVLFIATYGDFFSSFQIPNMKIWQQLGCEVHCAANFKEERYNRFTEKIDEIGVKRHHIAFGRSPLKFSNFGLYKQIEELMKIERFDIIDCHNPIVSLMARWAARKCKINHVVYTVHGFFFYKGCSFKNKILYKPIETFMARYTDTLILTNKEDYEAAKKMYIRGKAYYVPGVGVDLNSIRQLKVDRGDKRKELGIPESAFVLLSIGECIERKNHISAIQAFASLNIPNAYYVIVGDGKLYEYLKDKAKELGVGDKLIFPGYRKDANEILKIADIYIFPSLQEGLSVALMQAMIAGLPIIASNIRGNVDVVDDKKGGILVEPCGIEHMASAIKQLYDNQEKREAYGKYNLKRIEGFSNTVVSEIMENIFRETLSRN